MPANVTPIGRGTHASVRIPQKTICEVRIAGTYLQELLRANVHSIVQFLVERHGILDRLFYYEPVLGVLTQGQVYQQD